MTQAIKLAKKGWGNTNPNPLVGAVIVKNGKIIGQGYHKKYGDLHAEREALKNCFENKENPKDSVMYVTLEPCCHTGKQPPCTDAILQAGIKKVFIGSRDPNPLVSGGGVKKLIENGIEIIQDFMREECDKLNPIFFNYISKKKPYVALKWAMTCDGKIATVSGKSKWITCEKSREHVHLLRQRYSCILIGIGTVLADNPTLNVRLNNEQLKKYGIEEVANPVRVICDSKLELPIESNIIKTAKEIPTIIAHADFCTPDFMQKKEILKSKGIELLCAGQKQIDLNILMDMLYQKGFDSVLIEGGSSINFSALKSGIVNHIYSYIAPKIFGGSEAKNPVGGKGIEEVTNCIKLSPCGISNFDNDILIEYDILESN